MIMQSNRFIFIDIARTLAAIFMVLVHVLGLLSTQQVEASLFGKVINFLGCAPAAPIFMFAMGASFSFTDKSDKYNQKAKRGVTILLQGYILNIMRLVCPFLLILLLQLLGIHTFYTNSEHEVGSGILDNLLVVDILQFAGLAYLFLTLVSYLKINNAVIIYLIIAFFVFISPFLWGLEASNQYINRVFDLFWGEKGELVSFPFFPWIVYPLFGLVCGKRYLKYKSNISKCLMRDLLFGVACIFIGGIITFYNPQAHLGDYWRTGPGGLFLYVGFIPIWIYLCYIISLKLSFIFHKMSYFTSRNITKFYFTQWVIISCMVGVFGENSLDLVFVIILMVLTLLLTYFITYVIEKLKSSFVI